MNNETSYESPAIVVVGTVHELTLGATPGAKTDANKGHHTNKSKMS